MQTFNLNKTTILILILFIALGNSCQWLSTQVKDQYFLPAHFQNSSLENPKTLPPVSLKTYSPPSHYAYSIVSQIKTMDKHGHKRLQIMIQTPQLLVQEDLLWHLINQHRSQFQVIWIKICPQYTAGCPPGTAAQQAAWFATDIPLNERHLGFTPSKNNQELYLSK